MKMNSNNNSISTREVRINRRKKTPETSEGTMLLARAEAIPPARPSSGATVSCIQKLFAKAQLPRLACLLDQSPSPSQKETLAGTQTFSEVDLSFSFSPSKTLRTSDNIEELHILKVLAHHGSIHIWLSKHFTKPPH